MDNKAFFRVSNGTLVVQPGPEILATSLLTLANVVFLSVFADLSEAWPLVLFLVAFALLGIRLPFVRLSATADSAVVKNPLRNRTTPWSDVVDIRIREAVCGVSFWALGFPATMLVLEKQSGELIKPIATVRLKRNGIEQLNNRLMNVLWMLKNVNGRDSRGRAAGI